MIQDSLTFEEAEAESHARIREARPDWVGTELDRPFGAGQARWLDFKAKWQEGDRLCRFDTGPDSWARLAGRKGYCIVRDGVAVAYYVTILN